MAGAGASDDRCRVYLARAPARPAPADLDLLDRREREECERLATPALRARFACRHALLRQSLGSALGLPPPALRFTRDAAGRPRIEHPYPAADRPSPDFSLAGSGSVAAVAIATRGRVGVDVEHCRDDVDREALLSSYATAAERAWLRRRYGRARRDGFFLLWALKEAWSKALGTGLAARLEQVTLLPRDHGEVETDLAAVGAHPEDWCFTWRSLPGPAVAAVAWRCPDAVQERRPEFVECAGGAARERPGAASGGHAEPFEKGVRRGAETGHEQGTQSAQQQHRRRH